MRQSAIRSRKSPERPLAWREAEYTALGADATDAYDDRVSENIFDADDERAEVDAIVRGMIQGAN
jgi:hypothetical protein